MGPAGESARDGMVRGVAGYFARWAGLRVLIDQFLGGGAQGKEGEGTEGVVPLEGLQIVSLGSGFDTLFFQLKVPIHCLPSPVLVL